MKNYRQRIKEANETKKKLYTYTMFHAIHFDRIEKKRFYVCVYVRNSVMFSVYVESDELWRKTKLRTTTNESKIEVAFSP